MTDETREIMTNEIELNIARLRKVALDLLDGSVSPTVAVQLIHDYTIEIEMAMVTEPEQELTYDSASNSFIIQHDTHIERIPAYTLDFVSWCGENLEELTILFAETGASREMDPDPETELALIFNTRNQTKYPSLIWHIPLDTED